MFGNGHEILAKLKQLKPQDHIGFIYSNNVEQLYISIPFIKIGLQQGEQCIYIADDNTQSEISAAMQNEGIDVNALIKSGQLMILSKNETYLKNNYFDPDGFIDSVRQACDSAKEQGFKALRAASEMTWALDSVDLEQLVEYEIQINDLFERNDLITLCQYNLKKFPTGIIRDMIFAHPYVIYKLFERFFKHRS